MWAVVGSFRLSAESVCCRIGASVKNMWYSRSVGRSYMYCYWFICQPWGRMKLQHVKSRSETVFKKINVSTAVTVCTFHAIFFNGFLFAQLLNVSLFPFS